MAILSLYPSLIISRLKYETPEIRDAITRNYEVVESISNEGAGISYAAMVFRPKVEGEG